MPTKTDFKISVVDSYIPAGDETPTDHSKFHTRPSLARCSDGSSQCEKYGSDNSVYVVKIRSVT